MPRSQICRQQQLSTKTIPVHGKQRSHWDRGEVLLEPHSSLGQPCQGAGEISWWRTGKPLDVSPFSFHTGALLSRLQLSR